jgi:DNA-directed RNA polymerase specialized sigma24 family protein
MYLPNGYTEEQVIGDLQDVVNMLCQTFRLGYYDIEDMKQEGFVYGIEVLPRYDPTRGTALKTFLFTHIRNRFKDFRRDKLERRTPPCSTCAFYHPEDTNRKCHGHKDESDCNRWRGWLARNETKRNLMETASYEDEKHTTTANILDDIIQRETIEILERRMPLSLLTDFRRLIDGASLPKIKADKVYEAAREILKEDLDG